MPLKVIDTYFPGQQCLVYTGQLEGLIAEKRQLYRGRLEGLPVLRRNKRYNLRIRGRDDEGNHYRPLMCHARTDGAGDLYIHNRHKPVKEVVREASDPKIPIVRPRSTLLAAAVAGALRGR